MDSDGIFEIVTAASFCGFAGPIPLERGVAIWKYQPKIVYGNTVLEPGDFFPLWEDRSVYRRKVGGMAALRVSPLEGNGRNMVLGIGGGKLYLAGKENGGFQSRMVELKPREKYDRCASVMDEWVCEFMAQFPYPVVFLLLVLVGILGR